MRPDTSGDLDHHTWAVTMIQESRLGLTELMTIVLYSSAVSLWDLLLFLISSLLVPAKFWSQLMLRNIRELAEEARTLCSVSKSGFF